MPANPPKTIADAKEGEDEDGNEKGCLIMALPAELLQHIFGMHSRPSLLETISQINAFLNVTGRRFPDVPGTRCDAVLLQPS